MEFCIRNVPVCEMQILVLNFFPLFLIFTSQTQPHSEHMTL